MPPAREQLRGMGRAAALAAEPQSWERTAAQYLDVCHQLIRPGIGWPAQHLHMPS
jgi:hypothetical protein